MGNWVLLTVFFSLSFFFKLKADFIRRTEEGQEKIRKGESNAL